MLPKAIHSSGPKSKEKSTPKIPRNILFIILNILKLNIEYSEYLIYLENAEKKKHLAQAF